MKNPLNSPISASIGLLLARLPIGALFVMAGFMKFKMGVGGFVEGSLPVARPFMPDALGRAYLYALPIVELLVGAMLVLGWFARLAAFIATLILISIIMAVSKVMTPDGNGFQPTVFMALITLMLVFTGPGKFAIDGCCKGSKSKATAE